MFPRVINIIAAIALVAILNVFSEQHDSSLSKSKIQAIENVGLSAAGFYFP